MYVWIPKTFRQSKNPVFHKQFIYHFTWDTWHWFFLCIEDFLFLQLSLFHCIHCTHLAPVWPRFDSRTWSYICGLSLLLFLIFATRGFSLGTPVFPSPQIPTFPNSKFDLDYCQALYHKPLAWEIVQALSMLLTLNKLLYFTLVRLKVRFYKNRNMIHDFKWSQWNSLRMSVIYWCIWFIPTIGSELRCFEFVVVVPTWSLEGHIEGYNSGQSVTTILRWLVFHPTQCL